MKIMVFWEEREAILKKRKELMDGVTQEKETSPKQEAHVVYIKVWVLPTNRILSAMRHINHIV